MSFDKDTRNTLAKLVAECRRLLTADIRDQLQRVYGLQPDGTALPISNLQHLDEIGLEIARELRTWQDHLASNEHGTEQKRRIAAFDRLAQETAFTSLNRLAALRLCEERGHILECVRRGKESDGFALYEQLSGGALGSRGETYRQFLQRVFDELAQDLGVLFDRRQPQSLVFPGELCLEEVLALLNEPTLRHLWQEDETIGWIYQYYNSQEERRRMREESAAPRNSHELAVRNQFFTPRYVVEFLTDNTLGRIWYEMTKGCTSLMEKCRHLVRRPNENFLNAGQDPPVNSQQDQMPNKSQEELLKEPVYIPHRPLKDPREIRLLDPACGSMHFGLYAFDLFEVMYEEVWDNYPDLLADLRKNITDKREFLVLVPKLIIEHNLHGIEIDPRCTQIAGLSLWLRAQKTWQRLGLKLADRPRIARSNIVCAEPMPGEKELLREFTARLESPAIGQLVEMVFDKMQLAGEAGSLLKIEEEIRSIVAEAKALWKQGPKYEQAKLFGDLQAKPEQQEFKLDLSGISDEQFWERAEELIYTALREYAEQAQNGAGYQRRLFVEDAARGFAFIDLCRKRYDSILMNPPFGDASANSKDYIFAQHSREKTELGACFVTRTLNLLTNTGTLGVISNRTFLFAESFQSWREAYLKNLSLCADLGFGVLEALVETAAFVVESQATSTSLFVALINSPNKGVDLLQAVEDVPTAAGTSRRLFTRSKLTFEELGAEWFYYWLSEHVLRTAANLSASNTGLIARPGLQTCNNFRFVRLVWECRQDSDFSANWSRLSKGGEYQPFWADVHLVALWRDDGSEMKSFIERSYDSWSKQIPSVRLYFEPGLTYSERTTSSLSLRVFPAACLFDKQGPFVGYSTGIDHRQDLLLFLGLSYCYLFRVLVESKVGLRDATEAGSPARHYMPSMIERLPLPNMSSDEKTRILSWTSDSIDLQRRIGSLNPEDSMHVAFPQLSMHESLSAFQSYLGRQFATEMQSLYSGLASAERILARFFEVDPEQEEQLQSVFGPRFVEDEGSRTVPEHQAVERLLNLSEAELVQETIGKVGFFSSILKQSFLASRKVELTALCLSVSPVQVLRQAKQFNWLVAKDDLSESLIDFWIGSGFGRWDIRFATGEKPALELPNPFAPLPVCPPGLLQNEHGLPAAPSDVPDSYPLRVSWPGILVDDANHPEDIERRVREVVEVIWKAQAEAIEHEACEILGVQSFREYFSKPNGFFANHLKRYSKSRRQAPIYWPLSTASGNYTVWAYYQRLNDDFLYKVLNDYVTPKVYEAEKCFAQIESDLQRATGREATNLREAFEETKSFLAELRDFKAELLRVAELPYKPNLNDGVLITAAPLWKLFRLPKWRKDLKECWEQLEAGDYDWAHLAYSMWPERVQEKCKKDRSLAIAHGLEHDCETSTPTESSGAGRKRKAKAAAQAES